MNRELNALVLLLLCVIVFCVGILLGKRIACGNETPDDWCGVWTQGNSLELRPPIGQGPCMNIFHDVQCPAGEACTIRRIR
jgi:hypothetical protein